MTNSESQKASVEQQLWTLTCKITGNFILVKQNSIKALAFPFPQMRTFKVTPVKNETNQPTFELRIEYLVDTQGEDPQFDDVANLGRDILGYHLDLLSFLSGQNVSLLEKPTMVYKRPGTNKSRNLIIGEHRTLPVAVPITDTTVFTVKIEPQVQRVLTLLRKALQDDDVVDSFISLCSASEILAHQFEYNEKITKKCPKCGRVEKIKPSTRQQLEHLLIKKVGCSADDFKKIWSLRNSIFHGSFEKSTKNMEELSPILNSFHIYIIKGVKILLNVEKSELPSEENVTDVCPDPIADIECIEPVR